MEKLKKVELGNLDGLYEFVKSKSEKLDSHGYNSPSVKLIYGNDEKQNDSLLSYFIEHKENILKGDFCQTVAFLEAEEGHGNYAYELDQLKMSSSKTRSGNILIELELHWNDFHYNSGRNTYWEDGIEIIPFLLIN